MELLASTSAADPDPDTQGGIGCHALNVYEHSGSLRAIYRRPPSEPFQRVNPKRRKKNRQAKLDRAQIEEEAHHEALQGWVSACIDAIRRRTPQWINEEQSFIKFVDETPTGEADLVSWQEPCLVHHAPSLDLSKSSKTCYNPEDLVRRIVWNPSPAATLLDIHDETQEKQLNFSLPPQSGFCLSKLELWPTLLQGLEDINVVIIDPPWPNVSITTSRGDTYDSIDIYDLFKIDLPAVLHQSRSTVIAVWVTQKPKFRRFVKDKLFRDWGITLLSQDWYWVKCDVHGEPIFDMAGQHRRPYEGLIVGLWGEPLRQTLPQRKVFLTPLLGHSRKPDILSLLKPYLATSAPLRVLELFARKVSAGQVRGANQSLERLETEGSCTVEQEKDSWYLSAGLEALKFNEVDVWLEDTNVVSRANSHKLT